MCEGVIEEVKGLIVPEENCDAGESRRRTTRSSRKLY